MVWSMIRQIPPGKFTTDFTSNFVVAELLSSIRDTVSAYSRGDIKVRSRDDFMLSSTRWDLPLSRWFQQSGINGTGSR